MSKASVFVLNTMGIPCFLSGTAIVSAPDVLTHTPTGARFSVDVAVACSGIRSLFALMMVSAVWGHFTVKGPIRKWLVFLASAPLTVLGNLCRILILIFGTIIFGSEFAIGGKTPSAFHEGAGYAVFVVALAGLMVVTKIVNLDWKAFFDRFLQGLQSPPRSTLPPPPGAPRGRQGKIEDVY